MIRNEPLKWYKDHAVFTIHLINMSSIRDQNSWISSSIQRHPHFISRIFIVLHLFDGHIHHTTQIDAFILYEWICAVKSKNIIWVRQKVIVLDWNFRWLYLNRTHSISMVDFLLKSASLNLKKWHETFRSFFRLYDLNRLLQMHWIIYRMMH